MSHRIFRFNSHEIEFSGDPAISMSDTVFEFLNQEWEGSLENINNEGEDERNENSENVEDNKSFWEIQHQLLQANLSKRSSLESRIRNATKEALKEAQMDGNACHCRRPVSGKCGDCLMRELCSRLQNAGFNSATCKSKWRKSQDIPSGEHNFLDVVDNSNSKKGEVRVIIELNFRAEFEMAQGGEEYNRLVRRLPEVFVGKVERLVTIIKILCSAAKKCMKEKNMHMGPWRKQKYMQAKWLSVSERTTMLARPLSTRYSSGLPRTRPRASMLTIDLLDNLSNLHCTITKVT